VIIQTQAFGLAMSALIPTKIKLTYFDIDEYAEKIRICLRTASPAPIPFEDVRVAGADFAAMKPTLPNGQLPILQIDDGPIMTQNAGMFRWAGRLSGHMPSDPFEQLKVEEIIGLVEDMAKEIVPSIHITGKPQMFGHFDVAPEKLSELQGKMRANIVAPDSTFHNLAGILEKKLEGSGSGWFCGDKPTCADIEMFVSMRRLKKGVLGGIPADIWSTYPNLEKMFALMEAIPGAVLPPQA
jgi:glutathione S-transferase